ncbi:MAG TPA: diaminopimelate decarboxylase [Clostridiales bacterium]|nr:diaminopimelate decarboxylase [Clostridiales bacterium]
MNNSDYLPDEAFFGQTDPAELLARFGSPLYVYSETILRRCCRDMQRIMDYPKFTANYSIKANNNLHLLCIAREEGMYADAMSPGEIIFLEKAGFRYDQMFFVPNNVSADELRFALDRNILTSLDSLAQLELMGEIAPGSRVAIRINPGVGAGHHEKVVTGGKKTKFGIAVDQLADVRRIASQYNLRIVGVNQHIGSLFMEPAPYLLAAENFLTLAEQFTDLELIDLGGGFGIPYHKLAGESRLDLNQLNHGLTRLVNDFVKRYGRDVVFKSEPGRYVVAECGVLLGTVHAVKTNGETTYVGTDLGFNVLARPVMYDSWHDIQVLRSGRPVSGLDKQPVTVCGNICESGDIIAKDRALPPIETGDALMVMDTGAYGYAMSSNYNNRLRPAEVLIRSNGEAVQIRRRDTFEDLLRGFEEQED